jgi:hypothetical protein
LITNTAKDPPDRSSAIAGCRRVRDGNQVYGELDDTSERSLSEAETGLYRTNNCRAERLDPLRLFLILVYEVASQDCAFFGLLAEM